MSKNESFFKKIIESNRLRISLKELSTASGVSGHQLRYWEEKGYIHSEQSEAGKAHKYTLQTMFEVMSIKNLLDQGYTLAKAVEKQQQRRQIRKVVHNFIQSNLLKLSEDDEMVRMNIGQLTNQPEYDVEVKVALPNKHVELNLIPHQTRKK